MSALHNCVSGSLDSLHLKQGITTIDIFARIKTRLAFHTFNRYFSERKCGKWQRLRVSGAECARNLRFLLNYTGIHRSTSGSMDEVMRWRRTTIIWTAYCSLTLLYLYPFSHVPVIHFLCEDKKTRQTDRQRQPAIQPDRQTIFVVRMKS